MSYHDEPTRALDPATTTQADAGSAGTIDALSLVLDHREHWRRGERLRVEAYLARRQPAEVNETDLLDLIYNEVLLREEDGESPQLEEYLNRFPGHAEELRAQFEVHQALLASRPVTLMLSTASLDLSAPALELPALARERREDATTEMASGSRIGQGLEPPKIVPAAETDHVPDPNPGWPRVEGYDILGVLGSGGMGTVYRAFDRRRQRPVAIKTMNNVGAPALLRFKHEFRSLLDVAHPNLVTLLELICDGRNWFLTMELLDGVDFRRHVESAGPPGVLDDTLPCSSVEITAGAVDTGEATVAEVEADSALKSITARPGETAGRSLTRRQRAALRAALRQLAEGIAALHAAGKLHRDIKPSNVIVTREGRVVLLDFGLVAEQGQDGRHRSTEEHLVGTAAYMAPEQAANQPVSAASDWYSVGVMLYEALTGRLPFVGGVLSVLMDKQRFEPPPPRELVPDVPEDLNALCVDLLRRQPESRPSGQEILRRLGSVRPVDDQASEKAGTRLSGSKSSLAQGLKLIGRQHHRSELESALTDMRRGRTVAVYLHGSSGAGKTALLQSFLDERRAQGDAVVLPGRCYERESVPYKALDSLIDALGRYLGRLPPAEIAALLPRDVGSLARVFPSLRRVEAVAQAPRRGFESPDPRELRRRAFSALREVLARLGDRSPLILAIDDLQWGDVDSAALLGELLRPPDAPVLLFLGTYRTEDRETSPFLQALFEAPAPALDCRVLAVEPLTPDESRALARALLGENQGGREPLVEAIVRESRGNPFFVAELAHHVQTGGLGEELDPAHVVGSGLPQGAEATRLMLDEVLWSRIQRLPVEARQVLELTAVSGRPLRLAELGKCAGLAQDERVALALLRAGRLIRGTGRAEADEVETYHDRVRETVVTRLEPAVVREHHHRLALVLEASGQADPEVLGVHFLGAELPERAADYLAQAADQAAEALAFERAAALYRRALELQPGQPGRERVLRARLGDALANAGRGAEAASAYIAAVPHATVAESLELHRRAAMQLLISGHIDEGLATLQTVLGTVGMTLPSTPRRALVSLLWQRGRLRLRGLGFRERDPSEISAADLTRIDVCWSAGAGLSVVDTIRGADFQARGLLLSLEAGEPSRIARALAMEAAHAASSGGNNRKTTARLLEVAEALAVRVEHPYALGMVTLARGVAAYLEGRWRDAQTECDRAETIFRDRCTGVAWEIDTANAFSLWGLSHQGEVAELSRRWPVLLNQARERGDLYAVMNLSSYLMSIVRLAADDSETAHDQLRQTMARWSRQGYHVQHNDAIWADVQIKLYRGEGESAWNLIRQTWPALRRSLLLRVQFIRTSMRFLRARAALAAAAELKRSRPAEVRSLLAIAGRDARALERERMPCPAAYACMIRGGLAALHGDAERAASLLAEAVERFEAVEMRLCAAAVRRRRGELIGGDAGQAEVGLADRWMNARKIRSPQRMTSMILTQIHD